MWACEMNFLNLNAAIMVFIGLLHHLCPISLPHVVFPNCLDLLHYQGILLAMWHLNLIGLLLNIPWSLFVEFLESLSVCSEESLVAAEASEDLGICCLIHQFLPFVFSSHFVGTCSTFWAYWYSFELFSHVFTIGQLGTICWNSICLLLAQRYSPLLSYLDFHATSHKRLLYSLQVSQS